MNRIKNLGIDMWLKIILICSFGITLTVGNNVEIDTLKDLQAVGEIGTCTNYFVNSGDITCKNIPPGTTTTGFWSSCGTTCELKIILGNLVGNAAIPTQIDVLAYVAGLNTQILVRTKLTPADPYRNLQPSIENTGGWISTSYTLDPALGYSSVSEIYFRLVSSSFADEIDALDKITFTYDDPPVPTTTTTTTTTTTQAPPLPDDEWDSGDPAIPPLGWSTDCTYHAHHEDFASSLCPMKVPIESGSKIGFWSSCGRYCAVTYSPRVVGKPIPTSITINSFVSGHATLDIWVRVRGVLKLVGTIKDTTWTNNTFLLNQFGLDQNSEILFEPSSTRYPNHVDLIDKITVRFSASPML